MKYLIEIDLLVLGERGSIKIEDTEEASVIGSKLIIEGEKLKDFLNEKSFSYNPYDGSYNGKADNFVRAWVKINNDNYNRVKIINIKGKWKNPKNWTPAFESEEGVVY